MNNELKAIYVRLSALEAKVGTLASPETTADVEGLSERDKFMRTTGQNEGRSDYINSAEYLIKHAPPSDSQAEGCQCPCHREGLWKLPDEITRLEAELETALHITEQGIKCPVCNEDSLVVYRTDDDRGRVACNFTFCNFGKAIRQQENEDG